jgi:ribosomal protein L24
MKKIHTWDSVQVIASKWKWTIWKVLAFIWDDRIVVQWVNIQKRAKKGQWYIEKEWSIHISNVMPYDIQVSQSSKIWIRVTKKWKKERYYKKSWNVVTA